MKIADILKAAEELLYQILLWVVLVPKTLVAVLRRPAWAAEYITAEHEKPTEERFDAYMPPLLLLVVVGVIPNIFANAYWPETPYTDFFTSRSIVDRSKSLNTEHRILLYGAIWTLLPTSFAIVQHWSMRKQFSKAAFRPAFEIHCMKVAPIALLFVARFGLIRLLDLQYTHVLDLATGILVFAWLVYSDVAIARKVRDVSLGKAIRLAVYAMFLYYVLVGPVILTVTLMS